MIFRQRAHFFFLLALPFFAHSPGAQAPAKGIADYQVGDTALSNIVATAELVVIDREASAALRDKEALKIPAIVRFNTNATDEAVAKLRAAFAVAHEQFLAAVTAKFDGRKELTAGQINSAEFREFRLAFQNSNKGFPVTVKLASAWAAGATGGEIEQQLIERLRGLLAERRLRGEELPPEVRDGPAQVRLLALANSAAAPPLDELEKVGTLVPRFSLKPVSTARNDAQKRQQQPKGDRANAIFLASLIEPNCTIDLELTRQLRAKKTEGMWSADRYAAGRMIVRGGEVITPKVKTVLDQLASQSAVTELRRAPWQPIKYWPLIVISLSTGLIIAGLIVFLLSRRLEPRMDAILVQTSGSLMAGEPRALLGDGSGRVAEGEAGGASA